MTTSMDEDKMLLRIKGNSLDDGPGIRNVVFFKGCPLSCFWCHNPEAQRVGPELSFSVSDCVGCGDCRDVCSGGALNAEPTSAPDRRLCMKCFLCVEACPSGALTQLGRTMTAEEIVAEVVRDKIFMEVSGGGVTFSGGEATLHMGLVADVARRLKELSIHRLLETCGDFALHRFVEELFPLLDAIYFDLKLFDPEEHKRFCGRSNEVILDNFVALRELSETQGVELLPRIPLIPGVTDRSHNLIGWAQFLTDHGVQEVELLEYNPTWFEKRLRLGLAPVSFQDEKLTRFMTSAEIDHCHRVFHDRALTTRGGKN